MHDEEMPGEPSSERNVAFRIQNPEPPARKEHSDNSGLFFAERWTQDLTP